MPLAYTLANSTLSLSLVTDPYRAGFDSRLGQIAYARTFADAPGLSYAPLVDIQAGNRQAELPLRLDGTSLDDWIANQRDIVTILRETERYHMTGGRYGDAATLSLQLDGATNATVYDVLSGELLADQVIGAWTMKRTTAPLLTNAMLTLTLRPYGRASADTVSVTSGTLNAGSDTYTLTAPAGDRPIPLKLTVQPAAGDIIRECIIARRTRGNVANFIWIMECEVGDHGDYAVTNVETSANFALSNVADAAAHGGSKLRIDHDATGVDTDADIIQVEIQNNLRDHYGRFRVFLYSLAGTASVTGVRLTYGGDLGKDISNARVVNPGTAGILIDLGIMSIPHRVGHEALTLTSFKFRLQGSFANANFNWDIDTFILLPVDEQYAHDVLSADSAAQDKLVHDATLATPARYLTDSSDVPQPEIISGPNANFTAIPGVANRFFVLPLRQAGGMMALDLTDDFTLSLAGKARYELLR